MNVIVVGAGYVGLVAACCLASEGYQVTCVEKNPQKLDKLSNGISTICEKDLDGLLASLVAGKRLSFTPHLPYPLKTDVIMVAVGTPSLASGATDLSNVYEFCAELRDVVTEPLILVMKSTVPPGTGIRLLDRYFKEKRISYVANPEFLREGQAIYDWFNPDRIVIGTNDSESAALVRQLYPEKSIPQVITDITSAETIKYAANAFLVTKISFINEISNFCEMMDADIDDVARGIGLDSRIGRHFLRAGVGYGGSCFPKDVRALDFYCMSTGYDFRLLKSCIEVNTRQRMMIVQKLRRLLRNLSGSKIALLGLAFKPETDDVRESPAISIAHLLREEGVHIVAYDPMAMEKARQELPPDIFLGRDLYSTAKGVNAICLLTEWSEFVAADWVAIKNNMQPPYALVDGRNCLEQEKLVSLGFNYTGMGRRISPALELCR
jgi:UDPglucose 6-dehydrogenase